MQLAGRCSGRVQTLLGDVGGDGLWHETVNRLSSGPALADFRRGGGRGLLIHEPDSRAAHVGRGICSRCQQPHSSRKVGKTLAQAWRRASSPRDDDEVAAAQHGWVVVPGSNLCEGIGRQR